MNVKQLIEALKVIPEDYQVYWPLRNSGGISNQADPVLDVEIYKTNVENQYYEFNNEKEYRRIYFFNGQERHKTTKVVVIS